MVILDTLREFMLRNPVGGPVVVAVSGGIDSTALLVAFAELGNHVFAAAHVNHGLRGEESDADEAFVRDLCARYDVRLTTLDGTLDPEEIRRTGVESAARKIRYERLRSLGNVIATAHQKNDQAETVLMRLMTGGGIAALRGIHPVRSDGVIRPLLTVTRGDTEGFLRERGIKARADTSNRDPRYLRNRVRAVLAQFDAVDNLAAIADQAREQWAILEKLIDEADDGALPDDRWLRRAVLHRRILRLDPHARLSATDLERLALSTAKRVSVTKTVELLHDGTVRKRPEKTQPFEFTLRVNESAETPLGPLTIRPRDNVTTRQRFQLPEHAEPTFTIRNRRNGDRFQPLGMRNSKKLKDFLIDRKIPACVRDAIPLVIWNGQIVWVAGIEISERFKIADAPGAIYEVSIDQEDQEGLQRYGDRRQGR